MVGFRVGVYEEGGIMFKRKLSRLERRPSNLEQEKNLPCLQLRAFVTLLVITSDSCLAVAFLYMMKLLQGQKDCKEYGEEEEEKRSTFPKCDRTEKPAQLT